MGYESKDPRAAVGQAGRWHTGVFSKRPLAGAVKTRLVPPLTGEEAAELQEAMLRDGVERLVAAELRPTLWFCPPEEQPWFEQAFPGVALEPQRGADLARRMAFAFEDVLFSSDSAVLIGSDGPLVGADRIAEAHRALEAGADLVLGPDAGGGYYLIGLRVSHPELFLGIEMSTDDMCAATVERARGFGLQVTLLPEELDIDTGADLERLRRILAEGDGPPPSSPNYPHRTARFLAQHVSNVPDSPTR